MPVSIRGKCKIIPLLESCGRNPKRMLHVPQVSKHTSYKKQNKASYKMWNNSHLCVSVYVSVFMYMCVYMFRWVCVDLHVEVRGQCWHASITVYPTLWNMVSQRMRVLLTQLSRPVNVYISLVSSWGSVWPTNFYECSWDLSSDSHACKEYHNQPSHLPSSLFTIFE